MPELRDLHLQNFEGLQLFTLRDARLTMPPGGPTAGVSALAAGEFQRLLEPKMQLRTGITSRLERVGLPGAVALETLYLSNIGDSGAHALAAVMPQCLNLRQLHVNRNVLHAGQADVSMQAKLHLAAALPAAWSLNGSLRM